jgi:hypothetical protein
MRKWMLMFIVVAGVASTSGANASNPWAGVKLGESGQLKPQMLACGKMAMKKVPAAESARDSGRGRPAKSTAGAALLSRR